MTMVFNDFDYLALNRFNVYAIVMYIQLLSYDLIARTSDDFHQF